jgi:hypothetical protein
MTVVFSLSCLSVIPVALAVVLFTPVRTILPISGLLAEARPEQVLRMVCWWIRKGTDATSLVASGLRVFRTRLCSVDEPGKQTDERPGRGSLFG